jgi:L-amino acid N-acyltransferase YncA
MSEVHIRRAKIEDASQIHAIFSYYVLNSVATYYYEAPQVDFFNDKIMRSITDERFPFFVAVKNDSVLGYVYGSEYRVFEGYRNTIEDSIFIHPDHHQQGLGKRLLKALIDECKRLEYRTMIAIFGAGRNVLPGTFRLHEGFGFKEMGRLIGVGEKFGQILDTPILQLQLVNERRVQG